MPQKKLLSATKSKASRICAVPLMRTVCAKKLREASRNSGLPVHKGWAWQAGFSPPYAAPTDPFFTGRTSKTNGAFLITPVPGRKVSSTTWTAALSDPLHGCSWTLPPTNSKENAAAGLRAPQQRRSRLAAKAQSSSPGLTLNASRALGSQVL